MMKNKKRLTILTASIVLVLLCMMAFNSSLVTKYYNVATSKFDGHIRIAFIADLHSCDYGEKQKELIEAIDREKPDILLMGGDIVDDVLPVEKAEDFIEAASSRYPCFYVSGNHEYWSGRIESIKKLIRSYGVIVLEGDCEAIELNKSRIYVCGIDDPEAGKNKFYNQLGNCAHMTDSNDFRILLTHRPELIEDYLTYDFDLVLAGHAHGGQWRIPGIVNGIFSPDQGYFPQYAGGLYSFENTDFIVSRGLSKESTRVPRIFNPPELVIIDIN